MGGTFKIDGNDVGSSMWNLSGAHYGPGAGEQGGSFAGWHSSNNAGVYGVFAGQKGP
jgi:hypothetical protein